MLYRFLVWLFERLPARVQLGLAYGGICPEAVLPNWKRLK
jgi:hypothetical protein